jgi:hypothetical protein
VLRNAFMLEYNNTQDEQILSQTYFNIMSQFLSEDSETLSLYIEN